MSYTVDLERDDLHCRSHAAAEEATALIKADTWMPRHLRVSPVCRSFPERDDAWHLSVDEFNGCDWNEPSARSVWLKLAGFMADNASLEMRHEEGDRYRVRWEGGRVFEEFPTEVIWKLECEITEGLLK
jgi:hypothetical protein